MGSSFIFAQQWTGANNTTGDISRTGKVTIQTAGGGTDALNTVGDITVSGGGIKFHYFLSSFYQIAPKFIQNSPSTMTNALSIGLPTEKAFIMSSGKIGMGTEALFCTDCNDYRLFVKDGIRTEKIKVDIAANNGWADYVFEPDYNLMPLTQVEQFIKQNGHLPEVPTTAEAIANGIELKEMNILLLKKVEELTLYSIELQKRIEALEGKTTK